MHATRPLPEDTAVHYVIDNKASTFVVQAFSKGLLSAFGHDPKIAIRGFEGEASFSAGNGVIEGARLDLTIQADSLEVIDEVSEKDRAEIHQRMRDEVLETDRFPEIHYDCTRVSASGGGDRYWLALSGTLTLHGVTRPMPVSARLTVNGRSLRASGEFSVRQSDYEIAPVTAAGGAIRVKDELRCNFDIVALKKE